MGAPIPKLASGIYTELDGGKSAISRCVRGNVAKATSSKTAPTIMKDVSATAPPTPVRYMPGIPFSPARANSGIPTKKYAALFHKKCTLIAAQIDLNPSTINDKAIPIII
jgi:hypothetical protein